MAKVYCAASTLLASAVRRSIGIGNTIVELLLGPDLEQRLQVAQLHGDRLLRHHSSRILQPLGRLELSLRGDHLGTALALRLGLPRHRTLHVGRDLDVLDLDHRDLDAPRLWPRR